MFDPGLRPESSNLSGPAVEADGHPAAFDDHRYPALVLGVLQHLGQPGFVVLDIRVLDAGPFSGIGFTSRLRIGSRAFPENPNNVGHIFLLEWLGGFQ